MGAKGENTVWTAHYTVLSMEDKPGRLFAVMVESNPEAQKAVLAVVRSCPKILVQI
jgi:hypothetical protein